MRYYLKKNKKKETLANWMGEPTCEMAIGSVVANCAGLDQLAITRPTRTYQPCCSPCQIAT